MVSESSTQPPTSDSRSGRERRRHARAQADWPLALLIGGKKVPARLRDVSRAGVCFFVEQPIEEMTVLGMSLDIPEANGTRTVHAKGAVVRCEKVSPMVEHYEVAVFLHDISNEAAQVIDTFARSQES